MPLLGTRGAASARGFGFAGGPKPVPVVGSALGGGFFAGQISTAGNGVANYNLVVAPKSTGQIQNKMWQTATGYTSGTESYIDGPTNTNNMNDASHPAAQWVRGLSIGGYTDWYMPAYFELEIIYYNLKPTTQANSTAQGANSYAVPSRGSNYTSSVPAQTSAAAFQSGGAEAHYASGNPSYWSSTQRNTFHAWQQRFTNGLINYDYSKDGFGNFVRGVRRVAV